MLVLASAGFVFSAGGDGGRSPEHPAQRHTSFAQASDCRTLRVISARVVINAQIAAPVVMFHLNQLSKKLHSLLSSIRHIWAARPRPLWRPRRTIDGTPEMAQRRAAVCR